MSDRPCGSLVILPRSVFKAETTRAGGRNPRKLLSLPLVAVGGAILVAMFLLGCGGGDSTSGEPALPPNLVSDSDIDAQASGSPERALLEWWQSFQFGDSEQVLARTSTSTIDKLGKHDLSEFVKSAGQGLQGVEVLGSEETGNTASVRVGLLQFQPEKEGEPPPTDPTSSTPDTFEMKKEGNDWKYAAPEFLEPKIESFQESQKQQPQTTTTEKSTTTSTTSTGG
jgi:hypothetical protein